MSVTYSTLSLSKGIFVMNRKERRLAQKNKSKSKAPTSLNAEELQKAQLIQKALDAATELVQYEKLTEAQIVFQSILEHAPTNTTAMFNLGIIAHRQLNYKQAEEWFKKVLQINPNDSEINSALGVVYLDQGNIEKALELSEKALSQHPTAEAYARKAGLLRELGDMDGALDNIHKAIELKPDYVGAFYDLSIIKKFSKEDPDLKKMVSLDKKSKKLPLERQMQLKFALGKALLDAKEDQDGFQSYKEGNDIKRKTLQYDKNFMTHYFQDIQKLFTQELMDKFKDVGNSSKKPIFIIGMPRSGTTLIEQIISSHPDVYGAGELEEFTKSVPFIDNPDLPEYIRRDRATCHQGLIDKFTPDFLQGIGQNYIKRIDTIAPDNVHITDKMPFNFAWAGLIRLALPHAKIVHCTRNPMDTGLSIYRQLFSQATPWAYNLEEIGHTYNDYKKLTDYWHNLFPDDIYEANYETIIENQEEETRKLIKFCGLSWDDTCLEFYKSKRQVKTASVYQVRQPIYKASVKGWKRFEKQLEPLYKIVKPDTK